MRAVMQRGLRTAFVVGIDDLKRADQILASAGPRRYLVGLADGTELTAGSLDELNKLTDFKVRQIRRIEIATEWREILRASLTLQRDRKQPSLTYNLIGEEKSVLGVAHALDDWMSSVRTWYGRLATSDMVSLLLSTWLCVLAAVAAVACLVAYTDWFEINPTIGFGDTVAAAMWTIPLLLGTVLNFLRNGLFPVGTYLILDGPKWHAFWSKARQVLGGGFVLSLAAAFIATLAASIL
jgi:hypothetical protein